jgi:beta-N-acetylhexosaminidase
MRKYFTAIFFVLFGCANVQIEDAIIEYVQEYVSEDSSAEYHEYAPAPCPIDEQISLLTTEEKIGQLFMLRLPRQTTEITESVENLFSQIPMGGVILFSENVVSAEQVQALTSDLQTLSPIPLLIATDEEGGRVSRVGRLFENGVTPHAYEIESLSQAFETGETIGRELTKLGINMNFAPVADIWSNPQNEVIGRRAFGRTAETVAPMVEAMVLGLRAGGVMAVVKHFPGHGDTYEDSHIQLAIHRRDRERWQNTEALPFIAGINAGAEGVMTGHIATPAINDLVELPATFSDFWLNDILRGELGFDGLIITDALEMRALTDRFSCGQTALFAFLAGADILLIPHNPQEAFQAMLDGFHQGLFDEERLNQSLRRILKIK